MRRILLAVIICFITTGLYAGGVGTTGGQFLKIGVGAKPLATGGALGVTSMDTNALYFNPAGIMGVNGLEILSAYGLWLQGTYYGYVGAVKTIPALSSCIGVSAMYLGVDDMPGYDSTGVETASYNASDMGVGVTYAMNLGNLSFGVTGKWIDETLETYKESVLDMDLGVMYRMNMGIAVGLSVQNLLQSNMQFISESYPLSRSLRAGIAYRVNMGSIGIDYCTTTDGGSSIKFGGEYIYNSIVFIRAGYNMLSGSDMNIMSGICGGAGLSFNRLLIDYALVPYEDLGLTHRISLTVKL